jgi:hypothetical protein
MEVLGFLDWRIALDGGLGQGDFLGESQTKPVGGG